MHIRRATNADCAAICALYNYEVENSTVTLDLVPRTVSEQRYYLAARSGSLAVLVADSAEPASGARGDVMGFASLSAYRDRPGYRTSVEDSIYVAPEHQGKGVGRLLLSSLVTTATANGFHSIFARVADSQPASVALHESLGFTLVGIEREVGRKFGQWIDIALMQLLLKA